MVIRCCEIGQYFFFTLYSFFNHGLTYPLIKKITWSCFVLFLIMFDNLLL